jgi:uncharacterized protein (TIGR00299 family) protein
MHLHLDPLGGIAGDMFVAALLDAWPDRAAPMIAAVEALDPRGTLRLAHRPFHDETLTGSRFLVETGDEAGHHHHTSWRSIRRRLEESALPPAVAARAVRIFALLAAAEGAVHGCPPEEVTFHEVGALDSIADITAAAWLIETIGEAGWSVGPLPTGSGRIRTAHGDLPVPAPATVLLLDGFDFIDDGRAGERVTPTGAAILRHLIPEPAASGPARRGRLAGSGMGFGQRRFPSMSNVLRLLAYAPASGGDAGGREEVAVVAFEVDDQTAEDLAIGLDRLRREAGVHDLLQTPAVGKKGRITASIRLLVQPDRLDPVITACFAETTTIGLRWHLAERRVLARDLVETADGLRVKRARRPDGAITAKAESDDLANLGPQPARKAAREAAERAALAEPGFGPSIDEEPA